MAIHAQPGTGLRGTWPPPRSSPRPSRATGTRWSDRRARSRPRSGRDCAVGPATGPIVAILAEYDALRGLGHGCGHNLISAAGVGAAIALAEPSRPTCRARSCSWARPAEEDLAGKQVDARRRAVRGRGRRDDDPRLEHDPGRTGAPRVRRRRDRVHRRPGARVDRSVARPQRARRACILLFNAIGLWRQQLRTDARVHGIITDGGSAVNIIPGRAAAPRAPALGRRRLPRGRCASGSRRWSRAAARATGTEADDPLVRARADDAPQRDDAARCSAITWPRPAWPTGR